MAVLCCSSKATSAGFRAALASSARPALAPLSAAVFFSVCLLTLDIFSVSHLLKAPKHTCLIAKWGLGSKIRRVKQVLVADTPYPTARKMKSPISSCQCSGNSPESWLALVALHKTACLHVNCCPSNNVQKPEAMHHS